ncbi:hypothetical protein [Kineobactrum salinum]|uniref:Uncharacterized protein n=1 Tax=Kineobactrum salinum TaxID=2708301 RepID=A0A6C0U5U0_9GAMM|nr:hypothetical protein [Kineobactrum salinum]QIB65785.1 hypothetical protein G3T16_10520 [Kineobactrum salinum]
MKLALMAVFAAAATVAGCGLLLSPDREPAAVETVVYTPADWPQELQAEVYQPRGRARSRVC